MTSAIKNFGDNYNNLYRFYLNFVSYLKNQKSNLQGILVSIISARVQSKIAASIGETLAEMGRLDDALRTMLYSKLQAALGIEDPSDGTNIVRSIYQKACFSQDAIEECLTTFSDELQALDGRSLDFDSYFQLVSRFGTELVRLDSGNPPPSEPETPPHVRGFPRSNQGTDCGEQ